MVSGFLFIAEKDSYIDFVVKKGKRLLIPMFVFGLIAILMRFIFAPFTRSSGMNHELLNNICGLFVGKFY